VFKATDAEGKVVAIKIMKERSEAFLQSLETEIAQLRKISHKNVVNLIDY
jgi:flagellar motor switch protein FliG